MQDLADLELGLKEVDIVLLCTDSPRLSLFLERILKDRIGVDNSAIIDVFSRANLSELRELKGVCPPLSDRWFVRITLSDKLEVKDIQKFLTWRNFCTFIVCKSYKDYKKLMALCEHAEGVYNYYLRNLNKSNIAYLYRKIVTRKGIDNQQYMMTPTLFRYVCNSYSREVDKILLLFDAINDGADITSRTDIVNICGNAGTTVEEYIFELLKPLTTTSRGVKTRFNRSVKTGLDLLQVFEYSHLYYALRKTLLTFIEIKGLQIANLQKGLQEELKSYNRYKDRIFEVPMSSLLKLSSALGTEAWQNDADFLRFLYTYYNMCNIDTIAKLDLAKK